MAKPVQLRLPKPPGLEQMTAEEREAHTAGIMAGPVLGNSLALAMFNEHSRAGEDTLDKRVTEGFVALRDATARVKAGDMRDMEALLVAQAFTLNKIFETCALRAQRNMTTHPEPARAWLATAIKAQAASRCTVEALVEVKHPRTATFIRAEQANVAAGPQQVNNRPAPAIEPAACPTGEEGANELLGRAFDGVPVER